MHTRITQFVLPTVGETMPLTEKHVGSVGKLRAASGQDFQSLQSQQKRTNILAISTGFGLEGVAMEGLQHIENLPKILDFPEFRQIYYILIYMF